MGWPPEKTYTRRPDCLEAVSRIRRVVSLMGSLRIAPDVVCFSTMFSGTNGLTSLALTAHGAKAIAASSMLAITRTRDPSRLLLLQSSSSVAGRCGHDEAISGQLIECLADLWSCARLRAQIST